MKRKRWNDSFDILSLQNITPTEQHLLLVIATYANSETGRFYPSNATLASKAKLCLRVVYKTKKSLTEKNIIVRTDDYECQVPVFRLNIEEALVHEVQGGSASGAVVLVHEVHVTSALGAPKHIREQIIETNKLTGEKKPSLLKGQEMKEKTPGKKPYGKNLKDLNMDMDLRKEPMKKPKTWNQTSLLRLWDSTRTISTGKKVEVHTPAHTGYFGDQIRKSGAELEEIAEAIELVLEEWPSFYRYCVSQSIAYPAKVPNLKFFSRCITQAMDFVAEINKPEPAKKKVGIYFPDGSKVFE